MNFKILVIFAILLVMAMAASPNCGKHGDPCVSSSQCCTNMQCHRFANRCQVIITAEELQRQREKIFSKKTRQCGRHGEGCLTNSDCCSNLKCNDQAQKCQVQITVDELQQTRDRILNKNRQRY